MKRCPQCEFIYEDDQSLCDMDGILLVFDAQKLPKPVNTRKWPWSSRVVSALAVVVLTTILSLVYYVSTHQRKVTQVTESRASINAAAPTASIDTPPTTNGSELKVNTNEQPAVLEPKEVKAIADPEPKKPAKAKASSSQKPDTSNHSPANDSKIESVLKKTGRLLKKPFKF